MRERPSENERERERPSENERERERDRQTDRKRSPLLTFMSFIYI